MGSFFKRAFILSFLCVCVSPSVMAAQPVAFGYTPSQTETVLLQAAMGNKPLSDYQYAAVDLNADGMDEIIVGRSSCMAEGKTLCPFIVLGRGKREMRVLLEVEAWGISVGEARVGGVYSLHVLKNPNNAFKSTPYTWNAVKSAYTEHIMDERS